MSAMPNSDASPRQAAVLEAIEQHWHKYGVPPTARYIARHADISSTSVVHYHLVKLAKAKMIVMAGSPGSSPKPVPIELFRTIQSRSPAPLRDKKRSLS